MRIHFLGSEKPTARRAIEELSERYGQSALAEATHCVAIGGDGTALKALHAVMPMPDKPVFAMRLPDSVGALGNPFSLSDLSDRLRTAGKVAIRPLHADVTCVDGKPTTAVGINEIVISRQQLQAAKLLVRWRGIEHKIVGDGVLVATPIGSTGYNRSAGGPRLPLDSRLLAVTGVCVRQPSDWINVVLDDQTPIEIEVIDPVHRPVKLETSSRDVPNISRVAISCASRPVLTLLLEGQR